MTYYLRLLIFHRIMNSYFRKEKCLSKKMVNFYFFLSSFGTVPLFFVWIDLFFNTKLNQLPKWMRKTKSQPDRAINVATRSSFVFKSANKIIRSIRKAKSRTDITGSKSFNQNREARLFLIKRAAAINGCIPPIAIYFVGWYLSEVQ